MGPATRRDQTARRSRARRNQEEETAMMDESANRGGPGAGATSAPGLPAVADRASFQAELDRLRVQEKAHTREGDAIAAARRRLPMVEIDANLVLTGPHGECRLLDAFRDAGCSSPTTSCGAPAALRRSSARGAPGLHRRS